MSLSELLFHFVEHSVHDTQKESEVKIVWWLFFWMSAILTFCLSATFWASACVHLLPFLTLQLCRDRVLITQGSASQLCFCDQRQHNGSTIAGCRHLTGRKVVIILPMCELKSFFFWGVAPFFKARDESILVFSLLLSHKTLLSYCFGVLCGLFESLWCHSMTEKKPSGASNVGISLLPKLLGENRNPENKWCISAWQWRLKLMQGLCSKHWTCGFDKAKLAWAWHLLTPCCSCAIPSHQRTHVYFTNPYRKSVCCTRSWKWMDVFWCVCFGGGVAHFAQLLLRTILPSPPPKSPNTNWFKRSVLSSRLC